MLTGTRGLASVCLCFFCLLALLLQLPAALGCYRSISRQVQTFSKRAPLSSLDCMLYTPSVSSYEQNCPKSALKCFAAEVTVVIQEWKTIGGVKMKLDLDKRLEQVADTLNQTGTECFQCEQLTEKNAMDFFKDLEAFFEQMSSDNQNC